MATLTLDAVRKSYGEREVVHGITCGVADGELVVVVGPSGCGKSTLLRMVAGLEPVTSGTVLIDGRIVNAVEPKDRDIAMVFQNYALYPHMSVYDNMAYGLKMRKMRRTEIRERVERAAGILQLRDLLAASRGSFPAGSASGWRWGARSSATRRFFYSMNPCRTSMRSCGSRCASRSSNCSRSSERPHSTSLTTRWRR